LKGLKEFIVNFCGPQGTPYENGLWVIRIDIPDTYPFTSPSVGFVNKIYHPNVDEASGSVCLDVISQKWSSIYELSHIFDHFLPQLLQEPNVGDPLNTNAAQLLNKDPLRFNKTVKEYVDKHASIFECIRLTQLSVPDEIDEAELRVKIETSLLNSINGITRSLSYSASSPSEAIQTIETVTKNAANACTLTRNRSDPIVDTSLIDIEMLSKLQKKSHPVDEQKSDENNFSDDESSLSEYSGVIPINESNEDEERAQNSSF
jgi:ubiquitin-conjugating enzyme E2 H